MPAPARRGAAWLMPDGVMSMQAAAGEIMYEYHRRRFHQALPPKRRAAPRIAGGSSSSEADAPGSVVGYAPTDPAPAPGGPR